MHPSASNQQMQRWYFQSPGQQKTPPVTGGSSPTSQSQPAQSSQQGATPQLSINGQPSAEARETKLDLNGQNQAGLEFGQFDFSASVRVQASNPTQLKDWDVGVVQMVSGAVDTNCYRHHSEKGKPVDSFGKPVPHPVIVNRLKLRAGAFFPDRDPSFSDIFYDRKSMINLGDASQGHTDFKVGLHSHDAPGFEAALGAGAPSVTNKNENWDAFIERHLHHGFFYTYVVARNKATGQIMPLYTVNWWVSGDLELFKPDRSLPVTLGRNNITFAILNHHPFRNPDFWPVTTGDPMNRWERNNRENEEADSCPTQGQEIIRAGGGHG
jgi:hypothetical protein